MSARLKMTKPGSHPKDLPADPAYPFSVGVEYYRAPVPPMKFWDQDFSRIRAGGMRIIRTWIPWNWVEPVPGEFRFDDVDLLFELAQKHNLKVWFDTPAGTHTACPEWMIRKHPDMRAIWADGTVQQPTSAPAAPQGAMIHNYDHPKWREYVERYIRAVVLRYKNHPALLVWGTWDGISMAAVWAVRSDQPAYNDYTIDKYRMWLKERFTLDELNEYLMRRFDCWEHVEPPRKPMTVEMMLYRQFHYENMADHLGWLADLIDRLDGVHEQRSHGASFPRPWDEGCSLRVDGWGLSHHSANRLTSDDPYGIACEYFGFQWSRAIGRNGRWWNEEIYSNFVGGLKPTEKRTLAEEATIFLWLSLIEGAAGALYWQYRAEPLTEEGPGLNLVALDGKPTPRWMAIERANKHIDLVLAHLPLAIPRADFAIGYSAPSHELFSYQGQEQLFLYALRGLYRTLWKDNIAQDIVTPRMAWAGYRAVYLPNFAVLDELAVSRIRETLQSQVGPALVVDGHFGTYSSNGCASYCPPEGLADLIGVRIADFEMINERDVRQGHNILETEYGKFPIKNPCQYAILEPGPGIRSIATLGDDVVGVQSDDRRFTWFGISLSATSSSPAMGQPATGTGPAPVAHRDLALPLVHSLGIASSFEIQGDPILAFRRISKLGGSLVFLINIERHTAKATIRPCWSIKSAVDVLNNDKAVLIKNGSLDVEIPFGQVRVIYCHS